MGQSEILTRAKLAVTAAAESWKHNTDKLFFWL